MDSDPWPVRHKLCCVYHHDMEPRRQTCVLSFNLFAHSPNSLNISTSWSTSDIIPIIVNLVSGLDHHKELINVGQHQVAMLFLLAATFFTTGGGCDLLLKIIFTCTFCAYFCDCAPISVIVHLWPMESCRLVHNITGRRVQYVVPHIPSSYLANCWRLSRQ